MVYADGGGPSPAWSSPLSHLPVMCGLLHQPQSAQTQSKKVIDNASSTAKTGNNSQTDSSVSVIFHQALKRYWATCVLQRFVLRVVQPRLAASQHQDTRYSTRSDSATKSDDKDAFVTDESSKEDEMSKEADLINAMAPSPPPKKRVRSEQDKIKNSVQDNKERDRKEEAAEDEHSTSGKSILTTAALSKNNKSRLMPLQHWLFQSLFQSPSLRVRRTGCRILLIALEHFGRRCRGMTDQSASTGDDAFGFVGGALDRKDRVAALYQYVTTCLTTLTDEVLLDTSMYAMSGHAPEGGDPLVQTMGLLSWLVFQTQTTCLVPVAAAFMEQLDLNGTASNAETQLGNKNDISTIAAIISNKPLIASTVAELHPLTSSTVEDWYANMITVSRGKKRVLTAPATATSSKTHVLVEVVDVSAPAQTSSTAPAAAAATSTTTTKSSDAARNSKVAASPAAATTATGLKDSAAASPATKTTTVEKSTTHDIDSRFCEKPTCVTEAVALYSVEHFVSLGGVRWVIKCLLQLLRQLSKREARPSLSPAHQEQQHSQHRPSAHDHNHSSHYNNQEAAGSFIRTETQSTLHYECVQSRITLLLDLLLKLLSASKNVMATSNDDAVLETHTKNNTIASHSNRKAAAKFLEVSLLRQIWMSPSSSSSHSESMHSALVKQSIIHLHSFSFQSHNSTALVIPGPHVADGRKDSPFLEELSPLAGLISIMHAFSAGTAPGKSVHVGSCSSSSAHGANSSPSSSLFMNHPSGNVLGGTTTTTTTTTLNLLTGTVSTSRHLSSSSGASGGRSKHGRTQNGAPPLCKTMAVVRSYPHYFQHAKTMDRFMSTLLKVFNPLGAMMVDASSTSSSPSTSSGVSSKKSASGGTNPSSSRTSAKRKRAAELAAASTIRSITGRGGSGRGAFDTQSTLARLISRSTASLSAGDRASVLASLPAPAGGTAARRSLGLNESDDDDDDPNDDEDDENLDDEDDADLDDEGDDEDDDDDEDHDGDAMDEGEEDGVVVDLEDYDEADDEEGDEDDDDDDDNVEELERDEQTVHDDDEDEDHGEDTEHEDEDASVMGEGDDACVAGDEDANDIIIDDEEIESCCGLDEEEAHHAAIHLMNHEESTGEQGVFMETNDEDWNQAIADAASSRRKTGTNDEQRATPPDAPGEAAKSSAKAVAKAKGPSSTNTFSAPKIAAVAPLGEEERKVLYLRACMEVLQALHPTHHYRHGHHLFHDHTGQPKEGGNLGEAKGLDRNKRVHVKRSPTLLLSLSAEQSLTTTMNEIICPPPKPCHLKIFLRRAPTQEEFFRGNLSRNPVLVSSLKIAGKAEEGSKVSDLRLHIANELQMSDSAELLELLVAGKIVAMNLDLKTLFHTLWKKHVLESSRHASSSSAAADSKEFPPMVVTYRLAGVDGEATEDILEETENAALATNKEGGGENKDDAKFSVTDFLEDDARQGGGACGLAVLLRALICDLHSSLRRIRRDAVLLKRGAKYTYQKINASVEDFLTGPPPPSLVLLCHAARRSKNRKKLVELRAPSVLLRVLLEVLSGIGDLKDDIINATADLLQELIEVLASDINSSVDDESPQATSPSTFSHSRQTSVANSEASSSGRDTVENVVAETSLPLLLSSLMDTTLTAPLQKVVADLLPFLTYGQVESSLALADQFLRLVDFDYLESHSFSTSHYTTKPLILMRTFLQAAMTLPAVPVCNELRAQLVGRGFLAKCSNFLLKGVPATPPPWSPALFAQGVAPDDGTNDSWKVYLSRQNLTVVLKTLTGLCKKHSEAQCVLAQHEKLIRLCHWLESTSFRDFEGSLSESLSRDGDQGAVTSDGNNADVADVVSSLNELGLLSETLLDGIMEENRMAGDKVKVLRKDTRNRKREIAQERRSQTLAVISTSMFGSSSSGLGFEEKAKEDNETSEAKEPESGISSQPSLEGRSSFARLIANTMLKKKDDKKENETLTSSFPDKTDIPAWMAEMQELEDETGLTCAVCQEGLKFQPKELLGLYAYVKKITIPANKGGNRTNIDGTTLLLSLPATIPPSLKQLHSPRSKKEYAHSNVEEEFYRPAKAASKLMQSASKSTSSSNPLIASIAASSLGTLGGGRNNTYITSVTAGNPIHATCHAKAKQADRNHPKAPKSEWEGATLRNSRVTCNATLPLVSPKCTSEIPLLAIDSAIADHITVTTNMLGARPNCMLWTTLHDVRLLMLRIAYGEQLNVDSGGGNLTSNISLIYYQLHLAAMFEKTARHDNPASAQHCIALHLGYIAAWEILQAHDFTGLSKNALQRGISDAAPMAALCCVFHHGSDLEDESSNDRSPGTTRKNEEGHPYWQSCRNYFVKGLLRCAGKRHALGVSDSGCLSRRASGAAGSAKTAFVEWAGESVSSYSDKGNDNTGPDSALTPRRLLGKRSATTLEDYANSLRPMCVLFAMLNCLFSNYGECMSDEDVMAGADTMAKTVESCQQAPTAAALLSAANIALDADEVLCELEKGSANV